MNRHPLKLAAGLLLLVGGAGCETRDWPKKQQIGRQVSVSELKLLAIRYDCGERAMCGLRRFLERTGACALVVVSGGRKILHMTSIKNPSCVRRVARDRYGIASIAKSVTSLLFGYLLRDPSYGTPIDLTRPIAEYLRPVGLNYKGAASLEQVLTMASGMAWSDHRDTHLIRIEADEKGRPAGSHRTLRAAAKSVLKTAKFNAPGKFKYKGFDTLLLGFLVEHRIAELGNGMPRNLPGALQKLMWRKLPMKRDAEWKSDFVHHAPAYCCLYAGAEDMAKLGYWVLQRYRANFTHLDRWIRESAAPKVPTNRRCEFMGFRQRFHYGYQWWVITKPDHSFTGIGNGGQFLHVMPKQDVVVAQFGEWGPKATSVRICESLLVHRLIANALTSR